MNPKDIARLMTEDENEIEYKQGMPIHDMALAYDSGKKIYDPYGETRGFYTFEDLYPYLDQKVNASQKHVTGLAKQLLTDRRWKTPIAVAFFKGGKPIIWDGNHRLKSVKLLKGKGTFPKELEMIPVQFIYR